MLKKTTLNISGMHCRGCKNLIENEVNALPGVKSIIVDLSEDTAIVEYVEAKTDLLKIIAEIEKLNYIVAPEKNEKTRNDNKDMGLKKTKNSFMYLVFFVAFVLLAYFTINYFGGFELLAKLNEGHVAYSLLFAIGVLAGFHCVGMCGGLVIAYSAKDLRNKEHALASPRETHTRQRRMSVIRPHLEYNIGRIISYTIIGGILGGIGSFFGINPIFTGSVLIVAGFLMILMGLSFLTDFKILKKIKLSTPDFIARFLYKNKDKKKPKGPFIIGLLTGFMPCGPLQAMQLYALAQGNALGGALSMAVYALGTTIVMLAFGVLIGKLKTQNITRMLKFSGALIIILGLLMTNRGLSNFGLNFFKLNNSVSEKITENQEQEFQEIKMDLTYYGYSPNTLRIKSGVPVRWVINVRQMSGCTDSIMIESLGIKQDLRLGINIIEFTPPPGVKEIKFSCWMRMVWGKFIID